MAAKSLSLKPLSLLNQIVCLNTMPSSKSFDLPKVSILINNYNYAQFLDESIQSALIQTYPLCEVVVVDDGSKDASARVIERYLSHVRALQKENNGQASAFNAGFSLCTGDIICFLDADDYFYAEKVSEVVRLFQENPLAGWIFHSLDYVDEQGNSFQKVDAGALTYSKTIDFRTQLKLGVPPKESIPCGLCFRRSTLEKILPMPESSGVSISDNYLKYAAIGLSPGLLLAKKLAAQRIHESNTYTFRQDNHLLRAEIHIKTGYYLQQKFPEIGLFADKLFVKGVAEMLSMFSFKELWATKEVPRHLTKNLYPKFLILNFLKCTFHTIKFFYFRLQHQIVKS